MRQLLLFLHISSMAIWIGGMIFAHFSLRPALGELSEIFSPLHRIRLMEAVLRRFFRMVTISVTLLLASGFALLNPLPFAMQPWHWKMMALMGSIMTGIFLFIYWRLFPSLQHEARHERWAGAGMYLKKIRIAVSINLFLGVFTLAIALLPS